MTTPNSKNNSNEPKKCTPKANALSILERLLPFDLPTGKSSCKEGAPFQYAPADKWRLEDELIQLNALDEDIPITIGQTCEGIMVFGTSGSGKTSGAHDTLVEAMMKAGYGIFGICVKSDEGERLRALAKRAGRERDVVTMALGGTPKFNFLDSLRDGGADAVTAVFKQIAQALLGQVKENEWTQSSSQHLSNLVKLFILAGKKLEVAELRLAQDDFKAHKRLLVEAQTLVRKESPEEHTLKMVTSYFCTEWKMMGEKTRASVIMSLSPTLNPFCDGPMRQIFCTETNFHPRELRHGKILILDIACVGEQGVYGVAAGVIMKYMVQRTIETYFGNGKKIADDSTRPICIVADECQYVTTAKDAEFVTTSRSMRGSLFYLTQDINNFYRRGGETVKSETATLLSNLHGVRLMHQNEDKETYDWFMGILGKEWKEQYGSTANFAGPVGAGSAGASASMQHVNQLTERDFAVGLARGGKKYDFVVTGILQQAGRKFKGDKLFTQVAFRQMNLS